MRRKRSRRIRYNPGGSRRWPVYALRVVAVTALTLALTTAARSVDTFLTNRRLRALRTVDGLLTHYQKLDFLRKHPLVTLTTLWEKETYAVFAVLRVSTRPGDPDYFNDISPIASRADDALSQLRSRSLHTIPVDVRPTDALLALSTCLDDDRLVVVARKRRADEPTDALVSAVEGAYEGQGGIG